MAETTWPAANAMTIRPAQKTAGGDTLDTLP
jgi:hypothetical protein